MDYTLPQLVGYQTAIAAEERARLALTAIAMRAARSDDKAFSGWLRDLDRG